MSTAALDPTPAPSDPVPGVPPPGGAGAVIADVEWWRTAVVYQVYIRSFADGDGDGIGDVAGLRARLPHLSALGVDAIWINPWYASPQADAGYDVSDYRTLDPAYGTLDEGEALIAQCHAAGIRVLLDIVPNHTSDEHAWFVAALAGDPAARARYHFRPGRGPGGDEPPNNWQSTFGGPAWTRTTTAAGTPGEWYLHLFAPKQPDLDWDNPEVRDEFADILRFWFDRGVDGFRIDVAHGLVKDPALPDAAHPELRLRHSEPHPAWDQDGVHAVYRAWRTVADSYDPPRVFVAEAWVASPERLARYLGADRLHTAFHFDFLRAPWDARWQRDVIDRSMASAAQVGSPSTWVLANHDMTRQVTRYARSQPDFLAEGQWERDRWPGATPDLAVGTRRARAAILLTLALPGVAYLYQGEELGLEEVEDIPAERRRDPTFVQSAGTDLGRDGCRVPLPWSGQTPPFGFSPPGSAEAPWLPQPPSWRPLTVQSQQDDPASTLTLYREALRLRAVEWVGAPDLEWEDSPPGAVAFRRGRLGCWVNSGRHPVALPRGARVLLASSPLDPATGLPPDTAVWLHLGGD